MAKTFFDLNSGDTFNRWFFAPWEADINPLNKEMPPWLTAPVHYQRQHVIIGVDWGFKLIAEHILIPAIPGYRIVQGAGGFYYEKVDDGDKRTR